MLPSDLYNDKLSKGDWEHNPAQADLIKVLDTFHKKLNKKWVWKRNIFVGLYIWGSVGSGKTSLIDLMISSFKKTKTQRYHFHGFMEKIKADIQSLQGRKNPVEIAIKSLARKVNLIFIDEFCIHDIGYAVLLKNILHAAKKHNLFIIITSNKKPKDLYTGIINKELFNPAVDLIINDYKVICLDSDIDYRSLNTNYAQNYFHPMTNTTKNIMLDTFEHLNADDKIFQGSIEINGRNIETIKYSKKIIWLNFDSLCGIPRAKSDYIYMCNHYEIIFVSNIRRLNDCDRGLITNFCHFIDICYESKTRLIIAAECRIDNIFAKDITLSITTRTISRIKHMQTAKQ